MASSRVTRPGWPRGVGLLAGPLIGIALAGGCAPPASPGASATTEPAALEWLGDARPSTELEITGTALGEQTRHVGGAAVTPIKVGAVADVAWSADGRFAFALESAGVLRKFSVPGLVEQRRLTLPGLCTGLARCSTGLAVAIGGREEVWFIDEDLTVTARVPAVGVRTLAGAPGRPFVFATTGEGDFLWKVSSGAVKVRADSINAGGVSAITATPDGRYLFCRTADGGVSRCRISDAGELTWEETSPVRAGLGRRVSVSPDSLYAALPSPGGNTLADQPAVPFATYVFKVTNLREPVATVVAGPDTRAIGFDPAAKLVYAAGKHQSLGVFSGFGVQRGTYDLGESGDHVRSFLVHPAGRKLLVVAERLYWVELP